MFLIKEAIAVAGIHADLTVIDNGEEAIQIFNRIDELHPVHCPDLIMLDINLPRTDGFAVLDALRHSQTCSKTPVIIMTSSAAQSDKTRSAALGANAYFQKPSTYEAYLKIGDVMRAMLETPSH